MESTLKWLAGQYQDPGFGMSGSGTGEGTGTDS